MFILKDRLFMILRLLLTSMLIFTSLTVNAEEKAITYSQGQELIQQMNNTLAILRSWSNENKTKSDKLENYIKHDNVREQDNYEYQHKETWAKVKDLNQNSLMLLEASYAFAKKTESAAEFSKNSIRTDAWEKCIRSKSCTFKKLNEMMEEE